MMEWGVYPGSDGTTHVVPRHDVLHYWPQCWCKPAVGDDRVIVHNALDGRKAFEGGERRVN